MTGSLRCGLLAAVCIFYAAVGFAWQNPADPDMNEIASYTLSLEGLKKVINVNRAMFQQMLQDPKVREAMKVDEELKVLQKKDELTDADQKRIEELEARKEQLEDDPENPLGGDAKSLSEMEARIRKYPPLQQALQREGMAPREYAKFWLAFVQASFAHGMQKSGMLKQLPADVNAANIKFIADHEAEITAMIKDLEGLQKK